MHEARADSRTSTRLCLDGNEACARVAYALSDVIAIYPITPASSMGEESDAWAAQGRTNLWGSVPEVVEMQSEGGAAGAIHGALQAGALATTFTSSQGLLLMLPNMFKIAGELTPAVIHVAARTVATHALSIFGDHSDVMAARTTGFALLSSESVQEAQDLALVAHAATLESRVPFLHFFDGFRTSHEVTGIDGLDEADIRALIDERFVQRHRERGLTPDAPVLRGSAQNPDVFFQAREACNPFYADVPDIVQQKMDDLAERTGRSYHLVEYVGAPDAVHVIVAMGSGCGAIEETVLREVAHGAKVGLVKVRLFRPFPMERFVDALPSTVERIGVLDRTKEPGAAGEPLYQEVVTALAESGRIAQVYGGRYGLSSKEFTPAMVRAVFDHLDEVEPRRHFTVGIVDDVTRLSLDVDPSYRTEPEGVRALFFGLGSDGTVGAAKATVKIIEEETGLRAQGYSVYDSKKSGSTTVSHLRTSREPITSTYLIQDANFVACHQFALLRRMDVLERAAAGATLLLNSPHPADKTWRHLPAPMREKIRALGLRLFVIDAHRVAFEAGLGGRINTVMQPCFFALSGLLSKDAALEAIRRSVRKTYARRGEEVVERNLAAIERSLLALEEVTLPETDVTDGEPAATIASVEPDFVARVTRQIMSGRGDLLPVSALPVDGTFPTGTARYEKRGIASEVPIWDPELCIDCGLCVLVCPHAALRMKVYDPGALDGAPTDFRTKAFHSKGVNGANLSIQLAPLDCTACGVCVDVCPVKDKDRAGRKALNMTPIEGLVETETAAYEFFEKMTPIDKVRLERDTVKGTQTRQPLFEFSGACAGCGETPYLKLLSQLFGDRMLVANATGCSSIFGGNLPTTPWSTDACGRGPAWANSLFEDNAEFGFGIRVALDQRAAEARTLLTTLAGELQESLVDELLIGDDTSDVGIELRRALVDQLKAELAEIDSSEACRLGQLADVLVPRSVWIVGGDGWAYDIGSAGLDHVLASGRNVNILVLDTEVYSNTGGQASKSTPRGAVARFAAKGKRTTKKDLGLIAASYGDVYVAQVAMGANPKQAIKALSEAEAWPGPSLVIAYSTCIAHGIDMKSSMTHQKDAVRSGYWPLYRYHPGTAEHEHPFKLDSGAPSVPLKTFALSEGRFSTLQRSDPDASKRLLELAQDDVEERWRLYRQLSGVERHTPTT